MTSQDVPGRGPAAGGGRWVPVAPERLPRWIAGFGERHGGVAGARTAGGAVVLTAADGAVASCVPPPGLGDLADSATVDLDGFIAEVARARRIGLLLARKSAVGVGIAVGPELIASKVDTSYVQSRTAAGGWSQHRFARRRDNQAKAAAGDASDLALRILVPQSEKLDALVTGGDRRTVETILADRRLAPLLPLVSERFLDVVEPRLAVLQAAVAQAREVRIRITEPA